ncbi:MAG: hypothetical protein B6D58_05680 [candidate division Zixibacteria bacterium 4484_95]|nr:MAG: hypothetical protein B6D58_05680 [candidate division Zixibacteria bacterium 4484_95]
MVKKTNDIRFELKDKLWWWGSNILGFIASVVLIVSFVLTLPFRNYGSAGMRFAVRLIFVCFLIGVFVGSYLYYIPHQSPDFGNKTKYFIVNRGDTVYDIGHKLYKMGAISGEFSFVVFSRLLGHSRKLKSGRYAIKPKTSMSEIFRILTEGAAVPFNITIPEGLTVAQTADLLDRQLNFNKDEFLRICSDKKLDLSFYEAVIMASLIEKEAMIDDERPLISAVYHSRLKKRMRLQCDPSVIYALGGLNRPLYYKDLEINSPYNTYRYYGLPPGPICSPGKASLEAAVNPADVDYLYFVARGDGSHIFSVTNREHINAKNRIKRAKRLGLLP